MVDECSLVQSGTKIMSEDSLDLGSGRPPAVLKFMALSIAGQPAPACIQEYLDYTGQK